MTLQVAFEDEELPDLKLLLNRALNTWEPAKSPAWAFELEALVDARLEVIKQEVRDAHQTR